MTTDWAPLMHEAYERQVEYQLRHGNLWLDYIGTLPAVKYTRRERFRRSCRRWWVGSRFWLSNKIYRHHPDGDW